MTQMQRGEGTYPSNARLRELWLAPKLAWLRAGEHLRPETVLLDYGCGAGDFVGLVASDVARADGFDIDSAAVQSAEARFGRNSNFYSDAALLSPRAYDIITVTSVLQYIEREDLRDLCARLRDLLKDDPRAFVLVSDVIPPEYKSMPDALNSVVVGLRSGAAFAMAGHLARSVLRIQKTALTTWDRDSLKKAAGHAGFDIVFLPHNLTPSRQRYSCLLRPRA